MVARKSKVERMKEVGHDVVEGFYLTQEISAENVKRLEQAYFEMACSNERMAEKLVAANNNITHLTRHWDSAEQEVMRLRGELVKAFKNRDNLNMVIDSQKQQLRDITNDCMRVETISATRADRIKVLEANARIMASANDASVAYGVALQEEKNALMEQRDRLVGERDNYQFACKRLRECLKKEEDENKELRNDAEHDAQLLTKQRETLIRLRAIVTCAERFSYGLMNLQVRRHSYFGKEKQCMLKDFHYDEAIRAGEILRKEIAAENVDSRVAQNSGFAFYHPDAHKTPKSIYQDRQPTAQEMQAIEAAIHGKDRRKGA